MFEPLRVEIQRRFTAAERFFNATMSLDGETSQISRGLAFVQMYAAYEYAVKAVFRTAVEVLVTHNHPIKALTPSLMTLFLDSDLESLKACSYDKVWDQRLALFDKVFFSTAPASVRNTLIPHDGSNFRHSQLQVMLKVLGISRMPAQRKRHLYRIDEVVNNRNQIAHGTETPESIGKRYTKKEILHATKQVKSVCLVLVEIIEKHCSDPRRHRR